MLVSCRDLAIDGRPLVPVHCPARYPVFPHYERMICGPWSMNRGEPPQIFNALRLLSESKLSTPDAYGVRTGVSQTKLSRLMDVKRGSAVEWVWILALLLLLWRTVRNAFGICGGLY